MKFPKPTEWPALIDEYKQSGLSQKEFVAKHDWPLTSKRPPRGHSQM